MFVVKMQFSLKSESKCLLPLEFSFSFLPSLHILIYIKHKSHLIRCLVHIAVSVLSQYFDSSYAKNPAIKLKMQTVRL